MNDVIVALIALFGTMIGTFGGILTSSKLTNYRIQQLEKMLENVSIIAEVNTDTVGIGNTVSIKYVDDDEEDEYKLVGSQEADPFEGKISNESPIAQALLDHKVGDTVTVESPNGTYDLVITEIK